MPPESLDIRLLHEPLSPAAAIAATTSPAAGGIDIFLGTTRAEHHPTHGNLLALNYHAYEEMALRELTVLAHQAAQKWPIIRLVLWHRTGRVNVGEPSVIIAVACPHRAEAFEACRYIIEELKKLAPIWKEEIYAGSTRWQGDSL